MKKAMCQVLAESLVEHPKDCCAPCQHPWDECEYSETTGWFCVKCGDRIVFCWVCAVAGIYNMHAYPECQNGHMGHIYHERARAYPVPV